MQTAISEFPIVVEHRPGYHSGSRHHGSTFVRAHVMSRYHRERKAKIDSTGTSGDTVSCKAVHQVSLQASSNDASTKKPFAQKFVEYVAPKASRKNRHGQAGVSKGSGERNLDREKGVRCVNLVHASLQLRDPREVLSARLGLAFQAYSKHLDDRQLPLDILSETWLPVAFTDPVLFHAIMFNFSQQLYALCSLDHDKPYLVSHKIYALRYISSRIEKPKLASSDAVIASILCLIGHDFLSNDRNSLMAHIHGLRKLIRLRGGVDALGLKKTLKTVYLSYELLLSTSFRLWCTELQSSPDMYDGSMHPVRCNILTFTTGVIDQDAYALDRTTSQVVHNLEKLLTNHDTSTSSTLWPDMEHCIISRYLPEGECSSSGKASQCAISEAMFVAMHLALHLDSSVSELLPTSFHFTASSLTNTTASLTTQLKNTLNLSALSSLWYPIPGALLWCLVVGVETSQRTPEHPWFVANLLRAVTALAFVDWDGVKSCMEQLVTRGTIRP